MSDKTEIDPGGAFAPYSVQIEADSLPVLRRALIEALHRLDAYCLSRLPAEERKLHGNGKLNMQLGRSVTQQEAAPTTPVAAAPLAAMDV